MNVNPKVRAGGLAALVAAVVVTYVLAKVPGLSSLSPALSDLIAGVVTAFTGLVTGYLKKAEGWAEKYVADHKASTFNDLP